MIGRVARRHRDASDVRRTERIGGKRRGEGGIDAARKSQHDVAEPALRGVVAQAEPERLPRFFFARRAHLAQLGRLVEAGLRARGLRRLSRVEIDDDEVLVEIAGAHEQGAVGIEPGRMAVEDQLVVAADLIQIEKWAAVLDCLLPNHLAPEARLAHRERARRDVDEDAGAGRGELGDRIAGVEPLRPESRVVPDLLADGHAEPDALERIGSTDTPRSK